MYSAWLAAHVPNWSNFKIQQAGKYLGFWIGPMVKDKMLLAPFSKYKSRAKQIASANTAAAATAVAYNRGAVPVLGYHAQLLIFPKTMLGEESVIISGLLKIPHRALGKDLPYRLQELGGINFTSLQNMNYAAMHRAAVKTIPEWRSNYSKLVSAADNYLPIALSVDGHLCPKFWDTVPFVSNLHASTLGFKELHDNFPEIKRALATAEQSKSIQKACSLNLLPILHPQLPHVLFDSRLHKMLPEWSEGLRGIDWNSVVLCL